MAIIELIYTSFAEADTQDRDVRDILGSSEKNNRAHSITGLLLFDGEIYIQILEGETKDCLLYTSPSPRDGLLSRMPSSA